MTSNTTLPETVSWQNNYGRRTWDVISSCILTLVLCVWTALHLNVPKQNATLWERCKTKTLWVIIGIFAPEIVVYIAWVQYSSARNLLKSIQVLGADGSGVSNQSANLDTDIENPIPLSTAPQKHKWTITHCYFAGMGGFAFDSAVDNGGREFIPGSPSLHFTSHAILLLAQLDRLPNVSIESIADKSKADGLAKVLVCLQATWLIVQCGGRLAAKLPIALLEINTIRHCFCALIIYLIWWNKPLHVTEPIHLTGDWMRGFTSYSHMRSSMMSETISDISDLGNGLSEADIDKDEVYFETEMSRLNLIIWIPTGLQDADDTRHKPYFLNSDREPCSYKILSNFTIELPLNSRIFSEGEYIPGLSVVIDDLQTESLRRIYRKSHQQEYNAETPPTYSPERKMIIELSQSDLNRWESASHFLNDVSVSANYSVRFKVFADQGRFEQGQRYDELVLYTVSNFPRARQYVLEGGRRSTIQFQLSLATALYGGLHISSLNAHFPTVLERWLWVGSACFIALSGFFPTTLLLAFRAFAKVRDRFPDLEPEVRSTLKEIYASWLGVWLYASERFVFLGLGVPLACVFLCLYSFARVFIVVEAFISLRDLPLPYYDTPVWSNFIPHL